MALKKKFLFWSLFLNFILVTVFATRGESLQNLNSDLFSQQDSVTSVISSNKGAVIAINTFHTHNFVHSLVYELTEKVTDDGVDNLNQHPILIASSSSTTNLLFSNNFSESIIRLIKNQDTTYASIEKHIVLSVQNFRI